MVGDQTFQVCFGSSPFPGAKIIFFSGLLVLWQFFVCLILRLGGGGVFLLEVQYSILKSLISTCVLSYVGSREDWLLDRICES